MGFLSKLFGSSSGKGVKFENNKQQVTFLKTENIEGALYDVYVAKRRSEALAFLRSQEIKEEQQYIIVETSVGNFGKDLIAIFDEKTQEVLEFGDRKPLLKLKKSITHCAKCGYKVLPAGQLLLKGATTRVYASIEDMKEKGLGFYCPGCKILWCLLCVSFKESQPICGICGKVMETYREM